MSVIAAITAVGGYVPDHILSNHDFQESMGLSDEWITERTGIKERRILKGDHLGTSFMAIKAVEELLAKSHLNAEDIQVIICATVTPDMLFPCTSNLVCHATGAINALSFDMLAACSGFIYAVETGANFIRSGRYNKVIVVGADKMSCRVNERDSRSSFIFGDGAGAVLMEPAKCGNGVIDAVLKTTENSADLLCLKLGGSLYPFNEKNLALGHQYFFQDGKRVFKYAIAAMVNATKELLERNKLKKEDISHFVPHQANKRLIDAVARELAIDPAKVMMNIHKYGNTAAASIPLCLWDNEKQLKAGDKIILTAFGGGFTCGSAYITWAA